MPMETKNVPCHDAIGGRVKQPGRIVILGAGPTGLGAAHRLRELGYSDFVLYEREHGVGGLAASSQDAAGSCFETISFRFRS